MVQYIEFGDRKYPIRIGYYVMKHIQETTGKSFQKALEEAKNDLTIHEEVLFAALKVGAFAEKTEMDLKREDMPMVLDLVFDQYLKAFTSGNFFPKEGMKEAEKNLKEVEQNLGNLEKASNDPPPKKSKKSKPQT